MEERDRRIKLTPEPLNGIKILDLPLKAKWYDMIESGEKREEYREIKDFWTKRLNNGTKYTHVRFRYGYTKRTMLFEIVKIRVGKGNQKWGAPPEKEVYIIEFKSIRNGKEEFVG